MPDASLSGPVAAVPESESWAELLRRLIERRDQGRVLRLEAPVRARFLQHQRRWKTAGAGDEGESVSAALVKADQQALAMLLVLAEAEERRSIEEDLVDRTAAAIDFCLDCWRALPEQGGLALSRKDEVLDQAWSGCAATWRSTAARLPAATCCEPPPPEPEPPPTCPSCCAGAPAWTYWYLRATPELLQLAAERLELAGRQS
jgi:hypothetical protein